MPPVIAHESMPVHRPFPLAQAPYNVIDAPYKEDDKKKPAKGRLSAGKPASNKRTAAAVEPPEAKKRRKDETVLMPAPPAPVIPPPPKKDERPNVTDLSSLPTPSLISYLVKHDILPPIHPSPYTSQPTLVPATLLNPPSHTPPPVLPPSTATDPPRRSSRFQDDDGTPHDTDDAVLSQVPILTDLDNVHNVLSKLAERHWHSKSVRETETIAGFVWFAQRARERTLLAAHS